MKKLLFFVTFVLSISIAAAQDDYGSDKPPKELGKADAELNRKELREVLAGKTVTIKLSSIKCTLGDNEVNAVSGAFLDAGITPVLEVGQLKQWADENRDLRKDDEFNQETIPGKGNLVLAQLWAKVSVSYSNDWNSLNLTYGTFARYLNLNYSGQPSIVTITAMIYSRGNGKAVATYTVSNVASSADNIGVDIASGILAKQVHVNYQPESLQHRDQRAFDGAIRKFTAILAWKCGKTNSREARR